MMSHPWPISRAKSFGLNPPRSKISVIRRWSPMTRRTSARTTSRICVRCAFTSLVTTSSGSPRASCTQVSVTAGVATCRCGFFAENSGDFPWYSRTCPSAYRNATRSSSRAMRCRASSSINCFPRSIAARTVNLRRTVFTSGIRSSPTIAPKSQGPCSFKCSGRLIRFCPWRRLSAVAEAALPGVIRQMDERIRAEATADEAGTLWTAADVLMGLRYPRQFVTQLLQGVHGMKESVTYQAIVEEGGSKAGRRRGQRRFAQDKMTFQLGRRRFGTPDRGNRDGLRDITDPDRLSRMIGALLDVSSWEELLATP